MEKPSRDARRASPDTVLVVDIHRHAGISRAMLEEVPRDGEPREACAEDGVAQGAAAVPSCRRGRGGGGCDGSPRVEAETGE